MKSIFAILFSLVLVATQTAFAPRGVEVSSQKSAPHSCCHNPDCHKLCCVAKDSPASAPAPVVPARTVSQTDSQLLITVIAALLQPPAAPSSVFVSPRFSLPASVAVPLYERNCSYLI